MARRINGLPRGVTYNRTTPEPVLVNVYDTFIEDVSKRIVYIGSQAGAANFIGVPPRYISDALSKKFKIKKRYAVRIKSEKDASS